MDHGATIRDDEESKTGNPGGQTPKSSLVFADETNGAHQGTREEKQVRNSNTKTAPKDIVQHPQVDCPMATKAEDSGATIKAEEMKVKVKIEQKLELKQEDGIVKLESLGVDDRQASPLLASGTKRKADDENESRTSTPIAVEAQARLEEAQPSAESNTSTHEDGRWFLDPTMNLRVNKTLVQVSGSHVMDWFNGDLEGCQGYVTSVFASANDATAHVCFLDGDYAGRTISVPTDYLVGICPQSAHDHALVTDGPYKGDVVVLRNEESDGIWEVSKPQDMMGFTCSVQVMVKIYTTSDSDESDDHDRGTAQKRRRVG
ncbi:hypothetical protein BV22DRAFT_416513 [Leucogyrophana mollusca]|uniref:Uncharacterized protein n=1 Tax=Leucogyrophana mollusca TaxID=85980 RepID=A0ACB8BKC5_9AGAM|nr:hypothetical protein BV22DRAFT_416513 [Leucogyrophana mollusca]